MREGQSRMHRGHAAYPAAYPEHIIAVACIGGSLKEPAQELAPSGRAIHIWLF